MKHTIRKTGDLTPNAATLGKPRVWLRDAKGGPRCKDPFLVVQLCTIENDVTM